MRIVILVGVAFVFALTGCSLTRRAVVVPPHAEPPHVLTYCPAGSVGPPPPPEPRTIEQIGAWAVSLDAALQRTDAALVECSRRLSRLNQWIDEH